MHRTGTNSAEKTNFLIAQLAPCIIPQVLVLTLLKNPGDYLNARTIQSKKVTHP